jgi:hypothetical protein
MRRSRFLRAGTLGVLVGPILAASLLAAPLWAGQVRLVEGGGPERVILETSDVGADEALAVLAAHFGFAVERSGPSDQAVRFSGRLEGSLDELLERLLRHEGHMIVRSDAGAGIGRVVLMEAKGGAAAAPAVAGPIAALKAKLRERAEAGK